MKDQSIAFKAEMIRALFSVDNPKTQTRRLNLEKQYFVGQKLWVKENWQTGKSLDKNNAAEIESMARASEYIHPPFCPLFYPATQTHRKWCEQDILDFGAWGRVRIARFMPRWASRITLEVTAVREERLQDISDDDAIAEGIEEIKDNLSVETCGLWRDYSKGGHRDAPVASYRSLWESINGPGSWDENPVVKVISFKVVKP